MGLIYLFTSYLGSINESLLCLCTFLLYCEVNVHSQPVLINQYSMKSSESFRHRSNPFPARAIYKSERLVTHSLKLDINRPRIVLPCDFSRAISFSTFLESASRLAEGGPKRKVLNSRDSKISSYQIIVLDETCHIFRATRFSP
jgi:hypothetical protein